MAVASLALQGFALVPHVNAPAEVLEHLVAVRLHVVNAPPPTAPCA